MAELPDTSGSAVVEAEQESIARKRESALAGGPVAPRGSTAVTPTPDNRVARTDTRPVPYDQSGLNPRRSSTPAAPPAVAATRPPTAPPASRQPAPQSEAERRQVDDAAQEVQLAGASWVGGAGRQRVEPVAAETPGTATLDSSPQQPSSPPHSWAQKPAADTASAARRTPANREVAAKTPTSKNVGTASLDTPKSAPAETRFQVDRLMVSARLLLSRGELFSAYRTALLAERVASRDKVHFSPEEEHPSDLVRLIDREITLAARTSSSGVAKDLAATKSAAAPKTHAGGNASAPADEFSEAASRFAAWRPASNSPKAKFASMTSEVPAAEHGSRHEAAGFASTRPTPDLPADAWKNPSNGSPVILSSAISSADGVGTPDTLGLVIPAIEERKSIAELRPFEDRDTSTATSGELFQPKLPAIESMHSHGPATSTEIAFTPTGPLLPSQDSTGSRLDSAWDDELVAAASTESEGGGAQGWALTGGIVAIGVVLIGLARRLRAAR